MFIKKSELADRKAEPLELEFLVWFITVLVIYWVFLAYFDHLKSWLPAIPVSILTAIVMATFKVLVSHARKEYKRFWDCTIKGTVVWLYQSPEGCHP